MQAPDNGGRQHGGPSCRVAASGPANGTSGPRRRPVPRGRHGTARPPCHGDAPRRGDPDACLAHRTRQAGPGFRRCRPRIGRALAHRTPRQRSPGSGPASWSAKRRPAGWRAVAPIAPTAWWVAAGSGRATGVGRVAVAWRARRRSGPRQERLACAEGGEHVRHPSYAVYSVITQRNFAQRGSLSQIERLWVGRRGATCLGPFISSATRSTGPSSGPRCGPGRHEPWSPGRDAPRPSLLGVDECGVRTLQ